MQVVWEAYKCLRCGWGPTSSDRRAAEAEVTVHLSQVHHLDVGQPVVVYEQPICQHCADLQRRIDGVRQLAEQWRKEAERGDENARQAFADGLKLISVMSSGMATAIREKAAELEACLALSGPGDRPRAEEKKDESRVVDGQPRRIERIGSTAAGNELRDGDSAE